MNINNISLSPEILEALYGNSLVEPDPGPSNLEQRPQKAPKSYLGDYSKQILVIVTYPDAVYIAESDLGFLTKVLSACGLSLAEVAIFNLNEKDSASLAYFSGALKPGKTLLFGVTPDEIGLPVRFPAFQRQVVEGITYLQAPALSAIASSKENKAALWACLKTIFSV